ncbi:hypothetical protein D3C80_781520 [compost metagenome]
MCRRAHEKRYREERNHGDETDGVRQHPTPRPAPVHTLGIENVGDCVLALANGVEVNQIDRRPGDQEIQHQEHEAVETAQVGLRDGQGNDERHQADQQQPHDSQPDGRAHGLEAIHCADTGEHGAVAIDPHHRKLREGADQHDDGPEAVEEIVTDLHQGNDAIDIGNVAGQDSAKRHEPYSGSGGAQVSPENQLRAR